MKTRPRFIFSLLLALLAATLALPALPVLAQNYDMMVTRVRLTYVGRSSSGTDTVVGMVRVRGGRRQAVGGALVTVAWSCPDGSFTESALTDSKGLARFSTWAGGGSYTLTVLDVRKLGWDYSPQMNRASSDTIVVDSPPVASAGARQMRAGGGSATSPMGDLVQAQPKPQNRITNSPTSKGSDR